MLTSPNKDRKTHAVNSSDDFDEIFIVFTPTLLPASFL